VSKAPKAERQGGIRVDPGVAAWQEEAATNVAALTKKQRQDKERVRVKYDLPPMLKADIEAEAEGWGTSSSQFASFLLAWAMHEYHAHNGGLREAIKEAKRPCKKVLRFANNLDIPDEWGKVPE